MTKPTSQSPRRGRRSTRLWDRAAEVIITLGGMAVLAAVLGICVYLLWVVLPLFDRGTVERGSDARSMSPQGDIVHMWLDADLRLAAVLEASGTLTVTDFAGSQQVERRRVVSESVASWGLLPTGRAGAAGLGDGSIRLFEAGFRSSLPDEPLLTRLEAAVSAIDSLGPSERAALATLAGSPSLATRLSENAAALGDLDADAFELEAGIVDVLVAPAGAEALPVTVETLGGVLGRIAELRRGDGAIALLGEDFGLADDASFAAELLTLLAEADAPEADRLLAISRRLSVLLDLSELAIGGSDASVIAAAGASLPIAQTLADAARSFALAPDEVRGWIDDPAQRRAVADRIGSLRGLEQGDGLAVPVSWQPRGPTLSFAKESAANGLVWRSTRGDIVLTAFAIEFEAPVREADRGAAERLAIAASPDGRRFLAAVWEDGSATLSTRVLIRPLDGSAPRPTLETAVVVRDEAGVPGWLFATGGGTDALMLWADGQLERYGRIGSGPLSLMETIWLGVPVAEARMVPGSETLVIASAGGRIASLTVAQDPTAKAVDGRRIVERAGLAAVPSRPVELAMSMRERLVAVLEEGGRVDIAHATSRKAVASFTTTLDDPIALAIAPRNDGVGVLNRAGLFEVWRIDPGFPEATFGTLFGRVLYEGETTPRHVYQSSGGEEGGEPKLSITPLIFGTLKATVFAMLFAAPIAVLGAIYTSEFLNHRIRKVVKPTIELMASLPSVVLGFIAAIVVAPYVRDALPAVLVALVVVPVTVMVAAAVWQLAPERVTRRLTSGKQLAIVGVLLAVGIGLSAVLGPLVERGLFSPSRADQLVLAGSVERVPTPAWFGSRAAAGPSETLRLRQTGLAFRDGVIVRPVEPEGANREAIDAEIRARGLDQANLRSWLDGTYGGPLPGWFCVLILPSAIVVWIGRARLIDRRFVERVSQLPVQTAGLFELVRLLATLGATLTLAALAAWALSAAGADPRESILGPFSVRNTLVVGIIMGFAIIPIIYTISEDALRSVPESLRLASLGAGASHWQTAVRIALPVAASGIFSACMIGLGRAVGETMIVLMATGNTPEMSWNIFSGFRTLAANIAVELPEAPPGGTHYRVLFLCGLVLFAMTFVINTTAELVRQRYRKRSRAL